MNIGHFLTAAGEQYPERPAFISGDETTTYSQANLRTDCLAVAFQLLGLARGDRVATLMWNCPQMLESFFATWKAGGCVVPLNPRYVASEVEYQLNDSSASIIIFGEEFRQMVEQVRESVPGVRHYVVLKQAAHNRLEPNHPESDQRQPSELELEALIARGCESRMAAVDISDDDLAWLFYTSGTSGRPKGAMLTHGNLSFMALGAVADLIKLEPEDVGLHAAPLTHAAGFLSLAMVLKGSAQVILQSRHFNPEAFCLAIAKHRVTNTWLVPTQITLLLQYQNIEAYDLSSLKWIVYGGAPMHVAVLRQAIKRIGPVFVQLYGLGESPMTVSYLRASEHFLEGEEAKHLASCGHARSGIEIRILGDDGRQMSREEIGEVCVRGQSVMKGYWKEPDATAAVVQQGWLHTGDLGYMDDRGYLFIVDRTKDMIISGGANVYPREVEEILAQHPLISEVCVFGVPDDTWGEAVKAAIVPKPGATLYAEEIIHFVGERMAGYNKPKSVDFFTELPKSPIGKILRRQLRDSYWKGRERKI